MSGAAGWLVVEARLGKEEKNTVGGAIVKC